MGYGVRFLTWGKRACFTRPELKTERVSYDVITPSAARGILEAIYWKPAIRWQIDRIEVLNKIKYETFRRNEVADKLSYQNAKKAMEFDISLAYGATADKHRQQRATMLLKDVAYVINATFELTEQAGEDDTPEKHYNIALRRLRKGQHFSQPCLGCREFPAYVTIIEEGQEGFGPSYYAHEAEHALGFMLYDMDFSDPNSPEPQFYHAVMRYGIIDVATARPEVLK